MASDKLINVLARQGIQIKTRFNREFSEYIVSVYRQGEHYAPADYFTDCRDDAKKTAQTMLAEEMRREVKPQRVKLSRIQQG